MSEKTALITGASRGIGAETARALHRDGWEIVINYLRSEREARLLAEELGVPAYRADVSDADEVGRMFAEWGDVGLLVNNAGVAHYGLLGDMDEDAWRRVFAVNVDGAYHCIKCALPGMIARKSGVIINVSSVWGVCGASCEAAYSASKAALIGLTRSLAKELGPSGIRVNCVAPGVIGTDMLSNLTESDKAELCGETPLGRMGTPSDVAEVIAFLASARAGFITGETLGVTGGFGL